MLNRRDILLGGAAVLAAGSIAPALATPKPARRAGYGAALTLHDLRTEPRLGPAIAKYCTQIVPVYELKWPTLRPDAHSFSFEKADALLEFAQANQMTMRGHNLVWYADLPDWTKEIRDARTAERVLIDHISTVVSYYSGKLTSWDVVNEPIPDKVSAPTDRRDCLWSQFLGARYIPLAYRTAAAIDPLAQLTINEYDVESVGPRFAAKRAAYRNLISDLMDQSVPLRAVGLQCHLHGDTEVDTDGLAAFVEEIRSWGLDVVVTELDVDDHTLPAPLAERDAIVTKRVTDVLSAITSKAPLDSILTWGICDRYSWINQSLPRDDHLPNRPLPLDENFQPKPFWDAIARFTRETISPTRVMQTRSRL
jgi:endo-1,4-beta-xylanase